MQHHADSEILAVVLIHNEFESTVRCIESLKAQTTFADILVIDNHSDTDPVPALKEKFPFIFTIRHSTNRGVAGGRNSGIAFAVRRGYRYVLFLDNDAWADERMIALLYDAAIRNPRAGILGPKILMADAPGTIWRAGCTSWKWSYLYAGHVILKRFCQLLGRPLPMALDTLRGENHIDRGQFDTERDIDFQIGCAQLIRSEVFDSVGGLDEAFSPYGAEDIDFCIRARQGGWRIVYIPRARCWHHVAVNHRDEYARTFLNTRNILLLARKHLSPLHFCLLYVPDLVLLTLPLMALDCIFHSSGVRLKAVFAAVRWHMADIRKRKLLLSGLSCSSK